MIDRTVHPARIGLALVLSCSILIAATVWLLPASASDHGTGCLIAGVTIAVAVAWWAATRTSSQPRVLLGYPLITFAAIAALGAATTGIATSYGGLLTMAFIYVGLYGPTGSTLPLIPPATASWLLANGVATEAPLRSLDVRLPVAVLIWACVGGLLSQHTQATLRAAESLHREARRDPLTGLHNRRALDDLLAEASPGDAVALLDIDHFKAINDRRGHTGGDDVLVNFSRLMIRSLRDNDLGARFGGDEFLIYLPQTTLDSAESVLERIRAGWADHEPSITFSAGLAAVRRPHDGSQAFREADRYLYQAKASGRNRWVRPSTEAILPLARISDENVSPINSDVTPGQ